MSDETNTGAGPEPVVKGTAAPGGDDIAARAQATVEVKGGQALLVAQFAGIEQARVAYEALHEADAKGAADILGVLVVTASADGNIEVERSTDHSTRQGLKWGAVAGVALSLVFPPAVLVGAIVVGGVTGKAWNLAKKSALAEELASVIPPGTSGIVALVAIDAVDAVRSAIPEAAVIKAVPLDQATARAVRQSVGAVEAAT